MRGTNSLYFIEQQNVKTIIGHQREEAKKGGRERLQNEWTTDRQTEEIPLKETQWWVSVRGRSSLQAQVPPVSLSPRPPPQLTQWTDILLVTVAMGLWVQTMHKGWRSLPVVSPSGQRVLPFCKVTAGKLKKDSCCFDFPQPFMWLWLDYISRVLASRNNNVDMIMKSLAEGEISWGNAMVSPGLDMPLVALVR